MLIALVLGLSVLALAVAWGLRGFVLRQDNGTPEMRKISDAIQEGAQAFLRRQYRTIGLLSIALGVLIYVLYAFFRKPHSGEPAAATLALTTTLSFLFGAFCSGVAGLVGMYVAVRSNIRTASAARSSLNKALQIALRGARCRPVRVHGGREHRCHDPRLGARAGEPQRLQPDAGRGSHAVSAGGARLWARRIHHRRAGGESPRRRGPDARAQSRLHVDRRARRVRVRGRDVLGAQSGGTP